MLFAGLKLSLLGLGSVVLFLLALILSIQLSYRLLSSKSRMELAELETKPRKRQQQSTPDQENGVLIAVISAAIEAHRARKARLTTSPEDTR